ncbi:hypothetical protein IEQ34_009481 [Dendrobium chrysotoxum]|uniref:Uncharacterized protein n=1 Tax=Dendrobium chrysotoxum TaxID=161865 RepID=A0AAV7GYV8_DENCH|nr:hypothetical protein IEQ34_009481 [Dendrobium chrysotoxum]
MPEGLPLTVTLTSSSSWFSRLIDIPKFCLAYSMKKILAHKELMMVMEAHVGVIKLTSRDGRQELSSSVLNGLSSVHRSSRGFQLFLCKEFWSELFKKRIDNFETSHRGTFVVQDNMFRWIARISPNPLQENSTESSTPNDDNQAAQTTSMHLYFPCIIRGALTSLGIPCAVSTDISNRPACDCCGDQY